MKRLSAKNEEPLYTIVRRPKGKSPWGYSIPLNKDTVLHTVNRVRVITTKRNYYLAYQGDGKIHYQHMSAKNSSAEFYADVYVEVYPGVFLYYNICTNYSLTETLNAAARDASGLIERQWCQSIALMN